jgi:glycosyltransferase involved in cell wall biosynthesis
MGPMLNDILKLTELYPKQVEYLGVVSGKTKNDILSKAQVFILPSLYGEGLPMSLLEAMAVGLVPIVTNDGSMNTIVSHNETGFIIEKNNSLVLSNKIELLMADVKFRNSISEKAKIYALKTFSIKSYIYNLNEFYKKSIA